MEKIFSSHHFPLLVLLCWLLIISVISVSVTVYDKWAAKRRPKHRTRERTLLLLSAFGGSLAMYLTMLGIRHKTRHKKFMIGIPVIMILQAVLLFSAFYFGILIF
ncbi:MAG: DUF1294 domain-containing protein [Clostridia bacterium]|nr:DUF1294 domain-containing protein [Clostridia bacterium]